MIKKPGAVSVILFLLCPLSLPAQKKTSAPQIRFQGAPQYTQQELLATAGAKPDARLAAAQVKAMARKLNDTGLFAEVKTTADRKGALITLTPTSQLYPVHLENVPLTFDKDLDAKLRDRFPLYRGELPASGSINDGICRMFEELLSTKGVKATVKATLTSDLGQRKITAVSFAVESPVVHIGRIQLSGVSAAMQAKASLLASGQTGNGFDTENTGPGLKRTFENLYQDEGYAAVQVDVTQDDPIVSGQSIDIPYSIAINEGGIYKVGTIELPSEAIVTRAEIDKKVSKAPPTAGRPLDLFVLAVRDAYHAHGYLDSTVDLHPSYNEATHIVNYRLEISPGQQYRFAAVTFDGAPEAMAAKLKLAWKMTSGDVFDESYLSGFAAQAQKKDKQMTKWLQSVITTYDFKPDATTHQVNCAFHFTKTGQPLR
jgi:hypothetical protein